jgi:hypothetical protein
MAPEPLMLNILNTDQTQNGTYQAELFKIET